MSSVALDLFSDCVGAVKWLLECVIGWVFTQSSFVAVKVRCLCLTSTWGTYEALHYLGTSPPNMSCFCLPRLISRQPGSLPSGCALTVLANTFVSEKIQCEPMREKFILYILGIQHQEALCLEFYHSHLVAFSSILFLSDERLGLINLVEFLF